MVAFRAVHAWYNKGSPLGCLGVYDFPEYHMILGSFTLFVAVVTLCEHPPCITRG